MFNKYFSLEKIKAAISVFLKLVEYDDHFDDFEAASNLSDIFSEEELKELGISEYVRRSLGL